MIFSVVPMEFDASAIERLVARLWPSPARITVNPALPDNWYIETEASSLNLMVGDRVIGLEGDQDAKTRFVLALKEELGDRCETVWFTDAAAEMGRPLNTILTAADAWSQWTEVPFVAE